MKIFVLRHGVTGDSDTDEARQLTSEGAQEIKAVISRHKYELSSVQQILCSPMPRVRNTVELAADLIGFNGEVIETQDLNTGSRLEEVKRSLSTVNLDAGDLLISSHQSCTSILVLWLIGEDILIPNGSLLAIDVEELAYGKGKILWQDSAGSNEVKRSANFIDMF